MNTPIADFVKEYAKKQGSRFHMPGHKGTTYLGCEPYDITEIAGADALYEADGIIADSEANATSLFCSGRTFYSTEGSSQCIRAMLYLALRQQRPMSGKRPIVLAARNVHKAFVYAAALLDFDVKWIWPKEEMKSLCSCIVDAETVEQLLSEMEEKPAAVYLTSPDYLGGESDIRKIADVCHKDGVLLLVDNAHGAYLHFLKEKRHPLDLGADMCCDSAHKTFPVLTGGAYLHIHKDAPKSLSENGKQALALFGSTSPSYLILQSLDLCNQYLSEGYEEKLERTVREIQELKRKLEVQGWKFEDSDPLKITFRAAEGISGEALADLLRKHSMECEYADKEYCVLMVTPDNTAEELERLYNRLHAMEMNPLSKEKLPMAKAEQIISIRQAVFSDSEKIPVGEAMGRICASPAVGCPPAIPIAVSGERIGENAVVLFEHYGIQMVEVVKERGEGKHEI